jgi:hypothetical protein
LARWALQGGRELVASGVEHADPFVTLHGRQPGLGSRPFDRPYSAGFYPNIVIESRPGMS